MKRGGGRNKSAVSRKGVPGVNERNMLSSLGMTGVSERINMFSGVPSRGFKIQAK